jgi:hypothetical protein
VTFYSSIKDGDADEKEPYVISASNAKKQYDQLYKLFSEAYGSPDSEDGMDGAVWATWNDTNMGDVWLCWGKNLWGNDGYNDCMITITEDGAY